MRFLCKHHSTSRKSRATGLRPVQRINDLNCQARVLFSKRKNSDIVLTSFDETHSHIITEEMYRRDTDKITEDDHDLIKTLVAGNCKPQQIRRRLKEDRDTRVTIQAVRRAISIIGGKQDNFIKFNKYLDYLKSIGTTIEYGVFPSNKLRYLTISTKKMKQAYLSSNPCVVQCDTTFNFESSGRYSLLQF